MKRDKHNLTIRKATWDETYSMAIAYHNPPLVIDYNGLLFELNAGYGDNKAIFAYGDDKVAILSTNSGLDYAGLQVIDLTNKEGSDDIFIQDISSQEDGCKTFFDRSESWQADYLNQYMGW